MKREYFPIFALLLFWFSVFLASSGIIGGGIINFPGWIAGQYSGTSKIDSTQALFLLITQIPIWFFFIKAIKKIRHES